MEKCPITGLDSDRVDSGSYRIYYNDEDLFIKHGIRFELLLKHNEFIENKHIIAGAILNKQLSDRDPNDIYSFTITIDNLSEKLRAIIYPKTPKEKLDNLFLTLYEYQKYDGEEVEADKLISKPGFWGKHFFKSKEEGIFYFRNLHYSGLISGVFAEQLGFPVEYQITIKGLEYYLQLTESGVASNKCFVAMSFGKNMGKIRNAIKEAIEEAGYDPLIMDEEHIDSDQSINDAIIVGLKSAKFCVADFTEQKGGVYFESGYALGRGKPVIYCCKSDHFEKTHFDTKHFSHIIYEEPSELKKRLLDKIKAWIK